MSFFGQSSSVATVSLPDFLVCKKVLSKKLVVKVYEVDFTESHINFYITVPRNC